MTNPTFAVATHGSQRRTYVVGRVLEVDGAQYVLPVRVPDANFERQFTSKAKAVAFAKTLGDVLPGIYEQDYLLPMPFAIISHEAAEARRAPLRRLGYCSPA